MLQSEFYISAAVRFLHAYLARQKTSKHFTKSINKCKKPRVTAIDTVQENMWNLPKHHCQVSQSEHIMTSLSSGKIHNPQLIL
jgi:hypothetical protein